MIVDTKSTKEALMPTATKPKTKRAATRPKRKAPVKKPVQKTSAREAAEIVLLEEGKPMHYREITRVAIERGLIRVRGRGRKPDLEKTTKTIRSYLAGEVQDGKSKKFVRVDSGIFALAKRPKPKRSAKS
jgi:hypothetical protein